MKIFRAFLLFISVVVIFLACSKNDGSVDDTNNGNIISFLNCSGVTISSLPNAEVNYSGSFTVPYSGGRATTYIAGNSIASMGVTGLSATLQSGTIASTGLLTYLVTGVPSAAGVANFSISFGGQSCNIAITVNNNSNTSTLVKGADVSWLTEMEAAGRRFYNSNGVQEDLFAILKNLGINTIRLRVWVNPANGWNNKADLIAKALRAKAAGMRIMINFHYSNSWADPGKQTKPAAWVGDINALKTFVTDHTTDVLNALKAAGISLEWVQVGNETNDGMLWPEGRASTNMANYAQLSNAGYDAVKSVFPSAKVIVHVSNGWDNSLFRWLFDGLKSNGGKWDVIGMSIYPSPSNWSALNTQAFTNMNDMVGRYATEVMVVEVGMSWDEATASQAFIADLLTKIRSVSNGRGLGVLYWEPQAYSNWQGYTLGAFNNAGKPTIALNAFKN